MYTQVSHAPLLPVVWAQGIISVIRYITCQRSHFVETIYTRSTTKEWDNKHQSVIVIATRNIEHFTVVYSGQIAVEKAKKGHHRAFAGTYYYSRTMFFY